MSRARAFIFTYNVFDENTEEFLQKLDCRYIVYGYEIAPTTGRPHLQGYVYFDNARSFEAVVRLLKPAHIEIAKGAPEQNYDYCTKDDNFFERGQRPLSDKAKAINNQERHRLALVAAREGRFDDIPPDLYLRYRNALREEYNEHRPIEHLCTITELRPWQRTLVERLGQAPDPRKILWICDPAGGAGKSTLIDYMREREAYVLENSLKTSDQIHLIPDRGARVFLMNYERNYPQDAVHYALLEKLKDGCVVSGKYQGSLKRFARPHVVVFANWEPNYAKLSDGRLEVIYVSA